MEGLNTTGYELISWPVKHNGVWAHKLTSCNEWTISKSSSLQNFLYSVIPSPALTTIHTIEQHQHFVWVILKVHLPCPVQTYRVVERPQSFFLPMLVCLDHQHKIQINSNCCKVPHSSPPSKTVTCAAAVSSLIQHGQEASSSWHFYPCCLSVDGKSLWHPHPSADHTTSLKRIL